MGEVVRWLWRVFVPRPLNGAAFRFELSDLLLEQRILLAELVVLVFKTLSDVLEGDVAFDLALLVRLDAGLEFRKLRLFAFSECALSSAASWER